MARIGRESSEAPLTGAVTADSFTELTDQLAAMREKLNLGAAPLNNITSLNGGPLAGFRNKLINGDFSVWQRGDTFNNVPSYTYAADRWVTLHDATSAVSISKNIAADYYGWVRPAMSISVTPDTAINHYAIVEQRIEDVRTFAGETVVVSFKAYSAAATVIAVELIQQFGSGGSAAVTGIGSQLINIRAGWGYYSAVISVPAIGSGVTYGSGHFISVSFWFSAGSDYSTRSANLGQRTQSGLNVMEVQVEPGSVATPFERRPPGLELALCQRYLQKIRASIAGNVQAAGEFISGSLPFLGPMRIGPTVTNLANITGSNVSGSALYEQVCEYGGKFTVTGAATGNVMLVQDLLLDAEI